MTHIEIRASGEPNFYSLVQGDRWLAVIQLNGEFTSIHQERILEGLLEPLAVLINQETSEAGESQ